MRFIFCSFARTALLNTSQSLEAGLKKETERKERERRLEIEREREREKEG